MGPRRKQERRSETPFPMNSFSTPWVYRGKDSSSWTKSTPIASSHAGWRGTCGRIAAKGIQRFLEVSSAGPEDLRVGVGPCIRKCCYQVGSDVRDRYRSAGHDVENLLSGSHLDMVKANVSQLQELGVVQIEDSGLCTACRHDLFYSYRREGATGRIWTIAGFVGETDE